MLDTSLCIELMRDDADAWAEVSNHGLDKLCVSTITVHELAFGPANTPDSVLRSKRTVALMALLRDVHIQDFDARAAWRSADVRAVLKKTAIGYADTLIAGHALELDLTVVTRNERHFSRLKSLKVVRW